MAETVLNPPQRAERLSFVDVLRGIAVFWMIEVHVVDVCLATSLKQGFFYNILNVSNGFVAVAFIFCAGAGFQLAFDRKGNEYRSLAPSLWQYLRRLGHILLLAYWLHLPAFSLQRTLQASYTEWQRFFDCDVLQTIVFSSLVALIVSMTITSLRIRMLTIALLCACCFFGTVVVWGYDPYQSMPMFFAAMFAKIPLSKFPLVPFSGYFFSGMLVMNAFMQSQNKTQTSRRLLAGAALVLTIVSLLKETSVDFPGSYDWWHVSAGHALFRTSIVVIVLMLLYEFRRFTDTARFSKVLILCGQESLFMYVFHLMLVYGTVSNFGLQSLAVHRWGFGETSLVYIVVCALSFSMASMWQSFKRNEPKKASRLIVVLMISFITIFALVPSYLADR